MRAILPCLLLAGCTGVTQSNVPSLLPRPIEREARVPAVAEASAAEAVAPDAALDARVQQKVAALTAAVSACDAALRDAGRLVQAARGAAAGSQSWLDAHVAMGSVDVARDGVNAAMADLDALAVQRAEAGEPGYPALDAAIAAATAEVERTRTATQQLNDALSR